MPARHYGSPRRSPNSPKRSENSPVALSASADLATQRRRLHCKPLRQHQIREWVASGAHEPGTHRGDLCVLSSASDVVAKRVYTTERSSAQGSAITCVARSTAGVFGSRGRTRAGDRRDRVVAAPGGQLRGGVRVRLTLARGLSQPGVSLGDEPGGAQPITAVRRPGAGNRCSTSAASLMARRQQSGWLAISRVSWFIRRSPCTEGRCSRSRTPTHRCWRAGWRTRAGWRFSPAGRAG